MRQLTLTLLALLSLSACQAVSPLQPQRAMIGTQAFMPHDPAYPTPNPCKPFGTQAFMPHDPDYPNTPHPYPSANPCPCQHYPRSSAVGAQAILPPDLNPGNPAHCN